MDDCASEHTNNPSSEHDTQLTASRPSLCMLHECTHLGWSPERSLWQTVDEYVGAESLLLDYSALATDASAMSSTNRNTNQLPLDMTDIALSSVIDESTGVANNCDHSYVQDPNINKGQVQCWQHGCNGRTFSSLSNYRRHCREKGLNRQPTCPECGRGFSRRGARDSHYQKRRCKMVALDGSGVPSWVPMEECPTSALTAALTQNGVEAERRRESH